MNPTPSQQAASAAATPNTTPLERVARAICEEEMRGNATEWPKHMQTEAYIQRAVETDWRAWKPLARAALQALRQVDDETVGAMADDCGFGWPWDFEAERSEILPTLKAAFTAGIDHILSQSPNQGSER